MQNRQLINARWKFTDALLRKSDKKFKAIFAEIKDEIADLYRELGIKREDLNKRISPETKRKLERDKRDWKKAGIITPYFQFLIDTLKPTNANILKIYVMAVYLSHKTEEFDECKGIFTAVANDVFEQAKQESDKKTLLEYLTWETIVDWTTVQTVNDPFENYVEAMLAVASDEMFRLLTTIINQEIEFTATMIAKLIIRQANRVLSVNGDKYSGAVEEMSRQVGNKAYFEPFPDQKVKFVAVIDDKTTRMCRSLNGQIFNTKSRNRFSRYSDEAGSMVNYDIIGLVEGINLPPIMDHFHYCRSTLTYQVD